MITKTPRLTILMVAMMTVLGTAGGPIAAFATAYGGNNDDGSNSTSTSLADRITEDVDGIIDEEIGDIDVELPTIPP